MNVDRQSLGMITMQGDTALIRPTHNVALDLVAYSRFKYGDGAVAKVYGGALAERYAASHPAIFTQPHIYVTSSAYKFTPPAAASLVAPFIEKARHLAELEGSGTSFIPFKIHRGVLTACDYAGMSLEDRQRVMATSGFSLPQGISFSGQTIVVIDDILITGSHEKALHALIDKASPQAITYTYIFQVENGATNPAIEAHINGSHVANIDHAIELALAKGFILNARFCKFVLSHAEHDIKRFCDAIDPLLRLHMQHCITEDGLAAMQTYEAGASIFTTLATGRQLTTQQA